VLGAVWPCLPLLLLQRLLLGALASCYVTITATAAASLLLLRSSTALFGSTMVLLRLQLRLVGTVAALLRLHACIAAALATSGQG
jgi:hypothetical protein